MSSPNFDLDVIGGMSAIKALSNEVRSAGAYALRIFEAGLEVQSKPDRSPVTQADQEVEKQLRSFIEQTWPEASFYGEESGRSDKGSALRFLVDPIDGTRAFIRGLPTWSVLVGIEVNDEPVVGIAWMPGHDEFYLGIRGQGAICNGTTLKLSSVEKLENAMVMHGAIQQFVEEDMGQALIRLGDRCDACRGSADFEGYRHVLQGRGDAVVDPGVRPYDICPAAVLIREAGGRFTNLKGEETIYGPGALASNGRVHDELVALLGT